jgi:L-alanine-DL-glutamate epimerase-like enolase superfamily enzyme
MMPRETKKTPPLRQPALNTLSDKEKRMHPPTQVGFDPIESIEAIVLAVPLGDQRVHNPVLAKRRIREAIIVRARARSGLVGEGYVTVLGVEGAEVARWIDGVLAPVLKGSDILAPEICWTAMLQQTHLAFWTRPIVMRAIAAIDVALWDALGKAAGLSLSRLWGSTRDRMPVVTMGTSWAPDARDTDVVRAVERLREAGSNGVKLKVGRLSPLGRAGDAKRLRAVRSALGPDFTIVADANQGWSLPEALSFARDVLDLDLAWLEEPCLWLDDHRDLARLRSTGFVRVGAGQMEISVEGCRRLFDAGAVDICNFDATLGGGPTAWRRVAALASAHHLEMVHHQEPQLGLQLVASVPNGLHLEIYEPDADPFFHTLIANRPKIAGGWCDVPQGAGWGLVLDEGFIAKYRI